MYAFSVLLFNLIGILFLMAVIMLQPYLPFNPQDQGAVSPDLAFNIAVSFVTNTNWQSYAGETTLSYFTQMMGLTVQNFLSVVTGLAVLMALIRGIRQRKTKDLGNFWKDVTKATLVLLPICLILALVLVSQGTVQTLDGPMTVRLLQPVTDSNGIIVTEQTVPLGPAASQEAIKELGTNGGGFLQHQLGPSVREPHAHHQHVGDTGHPDNPGQPMLHLREHGQGPASGDRFADRHAANIHRLHGSGHLG